MSTLTLIEAECDCALQYARLVAQYQLSAREMPIGRRSFLYQAGRCKTRIVDAAVRVEIWRQRELDRAGA